MKPPTDYRLQITTAQLDAYNENIAGKWECHEPVLKPSGNKQTSSLGNTERMETVRGYVLVEPRDADETLLFWVGNRIDRQLMLIGIEPDGYTHS